MKTTYYINGIGIISPQKTFDNNEFLGEVSEYHQNVLTSVVPDFKQFINPIQIRRLSRMLRIGLSASLICVKDAGISKPDGIITGTGYGLLNDTAKFLSEVLQQQEKHMTPTFFMQSTYNALSGLVALSLKCNGYNNTYVNKGFSFETALHDAMLQLNDHPELHFLVGGYDETDEVQYKVNSRVHHYKSERISNLDLFKQNTRGSLQGEGAAFFSLSGIRNENAWCMIRDLKMHFLPSSKDELSQQVKDFLHRTGLNFEDVDVCVSGVSGDVENDRLLSEVIHEKFSHSPDIRFKHLCGEFCTASVFGTWVAASILKKQSIPPAVTFNTIESRQPIRRALLLNQYMGRNYSFILLDAIG